MRWDKQCPPLPSDTPVETYARVDELLNFPPGSPAWLEGRRIVERLSSNQAGTASVAGTPVADTSTGYVLPTISGAVGGTSVGGLGFRNIPVLSTGDSNMTCDLEATSMPPYALTGETAKGKYTGGGLVMLSKALPAEVIDDIRSMIRTEIGASS